MKSCLLYALAFLATARSATEDQENAAQLQLGKTHLWSRISHENKRQKRQADEELPPLFQDVSIMSLWSVINFILYTTIKQSNT